MEQPAKVEDGICQIVGNQEILGESVFIEENYLLYPVLLSLRKIRIEELLDTEFSSEKDLDKSYFRVVVGGKPIWIGFKKNGTNVLGQ